MDSSNKHKLILPNLNFSPPSSHSLPDLNFSPPSSCSLPDLNFSPSSHSLPDLNFSPPSSRSPSSPTLALLQDEPKKVGNEKQCTSFDLNIPYVNNSDHDGLSSSSSQPPAPSLGHLESNSQEKSTEEEQVKRILYEVVSRNLDTKHAAAQLNEVLHVPDTTMDILTNFTHKRINLSSVLEELQGALILRSITSGENNIEMKMARLKDLFICPSFGEIVVHDHNDIMEIIAAEDQVGEILKKLVAKDVTIDKATSELQKYARKEMGEWDSGLENYIGIF